MNRLLLISFSLLFLVFLYACGQQSSTSTANNWWPHQDGYSWSYNVLTSWSGSIESYRSTTEVWTFNGTTGIYGLTAQKLFGSHLLLGNSSPEAEYIIINGFGAYDYGPAGSSTSEPWTIMSYPLDIGKKWSYGNVLSCEVMEDVNVSVPAGNYGTCRVRVDLGNGSYVDRYYANNVGLVKSVSSVDVVLYDSHGNLGSVTYVSTYELTGKNF